MRWVSCGRQTPNRILHQLTGTIRSRPLHCFLDCKRWRLFDEPELRARTIDSCQAYRAMVMNVATHSRKRRGLILELVVVGSLSLGLAGIALMFIFWPFRYAQVHPLLQKTFRSKVDVKSYRRTYLP